MKATIYKPDGTETEVTPKDKSFTLDELKEIVGGWIEVVALKGSYMVVNEEGKLMGLPFNLRATTIARQHLNNGDFIVGTVIIVPFELWEQD
jgi:hypothetical protein